MTAPPWATENLRPGEEPLWWARPSLLGLVPIVLSTAAAGAVLALTTYYGFEEPGIVRGTPALVLAVGGLLVEFARRFVQLRFSSYVITDDRLYVVTSFLTTDARSVPLSRVSRVVVRQGLLGRVFGVWTAAVTAYGEARTSVQVQAIRDGDGLLRAVQDGTARGANAEWLVRGD